jgi:septal ring factor EnvC (AmiA/AmiB activator)
LSEATLYAATVWQENQDLAVALRAQVAAAHERLAQIKEERRALEAEERELRTSLEPVEAAARALFHHGKRPGWVAEALESTNRGQQQTARLRVLSQTAPTPDELADRDVAFTTEGAA